MKKIALTIGDPAGIGPEIVVKALLSPRLHDWLPVVIGDRCAVEAALELLGTSLTIEAVDTVGGNVPLPERLPLIDPGSLDSFKRSMPDANNGRASVGYIKKAVALAMEGKVDAIVTAPISKEALSLAGFPWPGHTEMLAELTATSEYAMMLTGGPLRVILVTIHAAIKQVPSLITRERVLKTILLAKKACEMVGIGDPRIAVAGLNPHAGESGIFGREEIEAIRPAIDEARRNDITVDGPFPPDVIFFRAYRREVDIVVCMYHDQGLIPLKMIAFDTGVNVTVGLPIIRTSPDHGTAYDIAWRGIADPASMIEAISLASMLRL